MTAGIEKSECYLIFMYFSKRDVVHKDVIVNTLFIDKFFWYVLQASGFNRGVRDHRCMLITSLFY